MIYKIAFTSGTGAGGHLRSMSEISNWLNLNETKNRPIVIYLIKPQIYLNKVEYVNIVDIRSLIKLVKQININENNIVHFYDIESFSLLAFFIKVRSTITRCGGKNPENWPKELLTLAFSKENHEFFLKQEVDSVLVPNRLSHFKTNPEVIKSIKSKYGILENDKVVLRICRISDYYIESINQTIQLGLELLESNNRVFVFVIGSIENDSIYQKLLDRKSSLNLKTSNFIFEILTSPEVSQNAKEIIPLASHVVGTGRSLMESAILGRIIYVPNLGKETPIRVCEHNFQALFAQNFSGRYSNEICQCDTGIEIEKYAEKSFLLNDLTHELYIKFYDNATFIRRRLSNLYFFFRYIIVRICRT